MLRRLLTAVVLILALLGAGASPPRPAAAQVACVTFSETGKEVCGRFLAYWQANGGLAQQGLPLTDEYDEMNLTNGKTYRTQYFERARFEYHPENPPGYDVLLGLLGREQLRAKYPSVLPPGSANPTLGARCTTFAQTGKQVCGAFLAYWEEHGGLAQQGLPLTDLFLETNPTDGRRYPTQYFERARFEYHGEYAGTSSAVLLGLLGREQLAARYPGGGPGSAWGPTLAPLAGGQPHRYPRGVFTISYPRDWAVKGQANAIEVVVAGDDGVCWVRADASSALTLARVDELISRAVAQARGYRLVSKDQVLVSRFPAYRLVFDYQPNATSTERAYNVYFVTGAYVVQVQCSSLPTDFVRVAPIFDGIAGSFMLAR